MSGLDLFLMDWFLERFLILWILDNVLSILEREICAYTPIVWLNVIYAPILESKPWS